VVVDDRGRVLVPPGIRRQLGLLDLAVVSTATHLGRVVLWAPAVLDRFLEEP
jgi:hypothetical protein